MRNIAVILLAVLMLLTAGCAAQPEKHPIPSEPSEYRDSSTVPEAKDLPIAEDAADATASATQKSAENPGGCLVCGTNEDIYDGYCYYCHPDFLFTCVKCGNEQPYHRPEDGLCHDCAQAAEAEESADAYTGATPTVPDGMCKVCGLGYGDYDGYCYYCHPDFLFTCTKCGYEQPYHRPESGLCYECESG